MTRAELAEAVRTRPAMYFGTKRAFGAFIWLKYVLSDAIAEYEAGHSTFLYVRLVHGGRFEIIDDGRPLRSRGWSVLQSDLGRPARDTDLEAAAAACASVDYRRQKRANCLTLRLDPNVIDATDLCRESVVNYLRDQAALSPGWLVMLKDKRTAPKIKHMFHYPQGLRDLLPGLQYPSDGHPAARTFAGTENGVGVQGVVTEAPWDCGVQVLSYVNRQRTCAGGTHVEGLRLGVRKLYERDWLAAVAVTLDRPEFCGSTKDRLASDHVTEAVAAVVERCLRVDT